MQKITILPDDVVTRIRAGETIQRPVNAVKELIENSLDAGATNICIKIESGGKKLIEVSDNGCGMSTDDAKICFLPHATSKIKSIEDLTCIRTLGFRGEALHSISSISIMELKTKETGSDIGFSVSNFGGKTVHRMVSCSDGTHVIVKALFYNTPARKSAMKHDGAETLAITKLINRYMLLRPDVGFQYYVNGNLHVVQRRDMSEESMLSSILGSEIASGMKRVDFATEGGRVHGFVGNPNVTKKTSDGIVISINGRYIEDIQPYVKVVRDAYRRTIQSHDFPVVVLRITFDPEKIDPNIHPQKSNVDILDQELFKRIVFEAILSSQRYLKNSGNEIYPITPLASDEALVLKQDPSEVTNLFEDPNPFGNLVENVSAVAKKQEDQYSWPDLVVIGQYDKTYIIAESDKHFFLIDQHAMHEKQLFEDIYDKSVIDTFVPLSPYLLHLRAEDSDMLASSVDLFKENGLELDRLDGSSWKCYKLPAINGKPISETDIIALIRDTIGNLADTPSLDDFRKKMIAEVACKSSIRANEMLSHAEMSRMLQIAKKMKDPYFCPHGRPTTKVYRKETVAKWFKR